MRALAGSIKIWFQALLLAFQWLTVLPLRRVPYSEAGVRRSLVFYPLVGWGIGLLLIVSSFLFSMLFPPIVAGILLLAVWIGITGALHVDGWMDSADGLFSHRSPERMLEIMKDSRVGAWGVLACGLLLLLKGTVLIYFVDSLAAGSALRAHVWLFLAIIPLLSRSFMVWAVIGWPYARKEGFGTPLKDAGRKEAVLAMLLSLLCIAATFVLFGTMADSGSEAGLTGSVSHKFYWSSEGLGLVNGWMVFVVLGMIILTAGTGLFMANSIRRKLGGLTGDTYGALNEMIELVLLLGVSAILHSEWFF